MECSINFCMIWRTLLQTFTSLGHGQKMCRMLPRSLWHLQPRLDVEGKYLCSCDGVLYYLDRILKLVSCAFVQIENLCTKWRIWSRRLVLKLRFKSLSHPFNPGGWKSFGGVFNRLYASNSVYGRAPVSEQYSSKIMRGWLGFLGCPKSKRKGPAESVSSDMNTHLPMVWKYEAWKWPDLIRFWKFTPQSLSVNCGLPEIGVRGELLDEIAVRWRRLAQICGVGPMRV